MLYGSESFIKREGNENFDVSMECFDGAEMCELVGTYILSQLNTVFENENVGLYRDDGIGIFRDFSGQEVERKRKASIKKQIPISISKRISKLSSNEETFNNNIRTYSDALKKCGFQEKPVFIPETPSDPQANERRKRRRKIMWFNPRYSMNVKTNISKIFLNLLHKHFPPTHLFHKIFNKNTVKISYSCMCNMNSIISAHNRSILNPPKTSYGCNCRDDTNCPLQNQCLTPNIVY